MTALAVRSARFKFFEWYGTIGQLRCLHRVCRSPLAVHSRRQFQRWLLVSGKGRQAQAIVAAYAEILVKRDGTSKYLPLVARVHFLEIRHCSYVQRRLVGEDSHGFGLTNRHEPA